MGLVLSKLCLSLLSFLSSSFLHEGDFLEHGNGVLMLPVELYISRHSIS